MEGEEKCGSGSFLSPQRFTIGNRLLDAVAGSSVVSTSVA